MSEEFDKRDLNHDGKVSIGERIGYGIDEAIKDAKEVAGKAKVKAAELKEKAPEKFAEMKEDVKEAADKAKAKIDNLTSKKEKEGEKEA